MKFMNTQKVFLIVAALGLTPIALSYGLAPSSSLEYLFQIPAVDTNSLHIFRAIMGLYLAMVVFWLIGAFKPHMTQAAIYSLVVFMLGLAAGRILSLVLDGQPSALLILYLLLELGFGIIGMMLLREEH